MRTFARPRNRADIGSGTGFLSELFLKNGNRVYGHRAQQKTCGTAGEDLSRLLRHAFSQHRSVR